MRRVSDSDSDTRLRRALIDGLRRAALRIEREPDDYNWESWNTCNCGMLAQELLRRDAEALQVIIAPVFRRHLGGEPTWTNVGRTQCSPERCSATGRPLNEVFGALHDCGLTADMMHELEYLHNPEVVARVGLGSLVYNHAPHVVLYMRAWADLLEEGEAVEVSAVVSASTAPTLRAVPVPVLRVVDVRPCGKAVVE